MTEEEAGSKSSKKTWQVLEQCIFGPTRHSVSTVSLNTHRLLLPNLSVDYMVSDTTGQRKFQYKQDEKRQIMKYFGGVGYNLINKSIPFQCWYTGTKTVAQLSGLVKL